MNAVIDRDPEREVADNDSSGIQRDAEQAHHAEAHRDRDEIRHQRDQGEPHRAKDREEEPPDSQKRERQTFELAERDRVFCACKFVHDSCGASRVTHCAVFRPPALRLSRNFLKRPRSIVVDPQQQICRPPIRGDEIADIRLRLEEHQILADRRLIFGQRQGGVSRKSSV